MKTTMTKPMGSLFRSDKAISCCDCSSTIQLVIDSEATNEQKVSLMNHLNECESCNAIFKLDKTIKNAIQYKIEFKNCPPQLIENIRAKLKHNL